MTRRDFLEDQYLSLELQANGVMSAISKWEMSNNSHLRSETVLALSVQARLLMARAEGIREYLDRGEADD